MGITSGSPMTALWDMGGSSIKFGRNVPRKARQLERWNKRFFFKHAVRDDSAKLGIWLLEFHGFHHSIIPRLYCSHWVER